MASEPHLLQAKQVLHRAFGGVALSQSDVLIVRGYLNELEDQRDAAWENRDGWEKRARELEEQLEACRNALWIISTTTYPATYLGLSVEGVQMYGGSDDAPQFAREFLKSNPASTPEGT